MKKILIYILLMLFGILSYAQNNTNKVVGQELYIHGKARIKNGSVLFEGATGTTPVSGAGTRMMWIPEKAAFRAGYVEGTQWDDSLVGEYSTAMGYSTAASGGYSTAMGQGTTASGNVSTAMGASTTASGDISTAMGYNTTASGDGSTAMGQETTAIGISSTAMGEGTTASQYASTSMGYETTASGWASTAMGESTTANSYALFTAGRFNDTTHSTNKYSWVLTDPLFQVGNGQEYEGNNALTILKNGTAYIGDASSTTDPILTVSTTDSVTTLLGKVIIDSLKVNSSASGLADEALLVAPAGIVGGGVVRVCSATAVVAWAYFNFDADGTVTLLSNSTNVVNTDTDVNFCIIDNGTGFAFKNRLGTKYTIKYRLEY